MQKRNYYSFWQKKKRKRTPFLTIIPMYKKNVYINNSHVLMWFISKSEQNTWRCVWWTLGIRYYVKDQQKTDHYILPIILLLPVESYVRLYCRHPLLAFYCPIHIHIVNYIGTMEDKSESIKFYERNGQEDYSCINETSILGCYWAKHYSTCSLNFRVPNVCRKNFSKPDMYVSDLKMPTLNYRYMYSFLLIITY